MNTNTLNTLLDTPRVSTHGIPDSVDETESRYYGNDQETNKRHLKEERGHPNSRNSSVLRRDNEESTISHGSGPTNYLRINK